mmetsp:Transcript_7840/g.18022  ORF Transcript_7840/g.18022 Transcript_7840/m.18022 type:complete len:261 (-) Transcript_7840:206-988(-)
MAREEHHRPYAQRRRYRPYDVLLGRFLVVRKRVGAALHLLPHLLDGLVAKSRELLRQLLVAEALVALYDAQEALHGYDPLDLRPGPRVREVRTALVHYDRVPDVVRRHDRHGLAGGVFPVDAYEALGGRHEVDDGRGHEGRALLLAPRGRPLGREADVVGVREYTEEAVVVGVEDERHVRVGLGVVDARHDVDDRVGRLGTVVAGALLRREDAVDGAREAVALRRQVQGRVGGQRDRVDYLVGRNGARNEAGRTRRDDWR